MKTPGAVVAAAFLLASICGGEAWARGYIGRLTMGRATYPRGSLSLDVTHEYRMKKWTDPTRDTLRGVYEFGYGWRDDVTVEVIAKTRVARRDTYALDRVGAGVTARLMLLPVQVAPYIRFQASVRGAAPSVDIGFQMIRNQGPWTFFMQQEAEIQKRSSGGISGLDEYEIKPGVFYRFGLRGLGGAFWRYQTNGDHALDFILGGSIGRHLFLGIEERLGLTSQATDAMTGIHLSLYTGRDALGGWGL